jgi:hypothetical protein
LHAGPRWQSIGPEYLSAPDLVIKEGGKVSTEQFIALAEKQDEPEH